MDIYHYHPATGEYQGYGIADESPLEPGHYLVPANATLLVPPDFDPGVQICRYVEGQWTVEDLPAGPETAPPGPTQEQILALLTGHVQSHLDAQARTLDYDNIFTAVTYAEEPAVPEYQAEGRALRAWRSQVWAKCAVVLADVQEGKRAVPTAEELVAELPIFTMN